MHPIRIWHMSLTPLGDFDMRQRLIYPTLTFLALTTRLLGSTAKAFSENVLW